MRPSRLAIAGNLDPAPRTKPAGNCDVRQVSAVTDEDLTRARREATFRRQLLKDHMERLLAGLTKLRLAEPSNARADQIREGVELVAKLADLLQRGGVRTV